MKGFPGVERMHFIGIGGAGMSSLAGIVATTGTTVTGSDQRESDAMLALRHAGLKVTLGHAAGNLGDPDAVVYSSAVPAGNPELAEAVRRGIPVLKRALLLGEFSKQKWTLAVAGTHGKTTATLMMGAVWQAAGRDPTVIAGGAPRGGAVGWRPGEGDYLVVEADEFDRSFLALHPAAALVTNIEAEHLDCYRDLDDILATFAAFLGRLPSHGVAELCADDAGVRSLLPALSCRTVTYGLNEPAEYEARSLTPGREGWSFEVRHRGLPLAAVSLRLPGRHNVQNALGVFALSHRLGLAPADIARGLGGFAGAGRRLEPVGEAGGVRLYDDYAHHPSEVAASLSALKELGAARVVVVFQPHLYSRTRLFHRDFARALAAADVALVTAVYPAREQPEPGVDGHLVADGLRALGHGAVHYLPLPATAGAEVAALLLAGDVVVTMGAGDIHRLGPDLLRRLEAR